MVLHIFKTITTVYITNFTLIAMGMYDTAFCILKPVVLPASNKIVSTASNMTLPSLSTEEEVNGVRTAEHDLVMNAKIR